MKPAIKAAIKRICRMTQFIMTTPHKDSCVVKFVNSDYTFAGWDMKSGEPTMRGGGKAPAIFSEEKAGEFYEKLTDMYLDGEVSHMVDFHNCINYYEVKRWELMKFVNDNRPNTYDLGDKPFLFTKLKITFVGE